MGGKEPESRGPMFRISYEVLVRAFIAALLGILMWTYFEMTSIRKEKADRIELYEWRGALDKQLKTISDGVKRLEDMHLNGIPTKPSLR